jgi:acyl-CoA thioester hydrolase
MFTFPVTVYIEDTDALGHVFYARYLHFAERARSEWLKSLGISHQTLITNHQTMIVVAQAFIKYHKPAVLEDQLTVDVSLISLSKASMVVEQRIFKKLQLLTTLTIKLACICHEGKIKSIPSELKIILENQLNLSQSTEG